MAGETALITKGKAKYVAGINRIGGADKYVSCGKEGGMKTATCLKAAKAKVASAETWGETWATAMA